MARREGGPRIRREPAKTGRCREADKTAGEKRSLGATYLQEGAKEHVGPRDGPAQGCKVPGPQPVPAAPRLRVARRFHHERNGEPVDVHNDDAPDQASPDWSRLLVSHEAPCQQSGDPPCLLARTIPRHASLGVRSRSAVYRACSQRASRPLAGSSGPPWRLA